MNSGQRCYLVATTSFWRQIYRGLSSGLPQELSNTNCFVTSTERTRIHPSSTQERKKQTNWFSYFNQHLDLDSLYKYIIYVYLRIYKYIAQILLQIIRLLNHDEWWREWTRKRREEDILSSYPRMIALLIHFSSTHRMLSVKILVFRLPEPTRAKFRGRTLFLYSMV